MTNTARTPAREYIHDQLRRKFGHCFFRGIGFVMFLVVPFLLISVALNASGHVLATSYITVRSVIEILRFIAYDRIPQFRRILQVISVLCLSLGTGVTIEALVYTKWLTPVNSYLNIILYIVLLYDIVLALGLTVFYQAIRWRCISTSRVLRLFMPGSKIDPASYREYIYLGNIPASCPICGDEYTLGDKIRELPSCQHNYHVMCIDPWLRYKGTCPLCQTETSYLLADPN